MMYDYDRGDRPPADLRIWLALGLLVCGLCIVGVLLEAGS